MLACMYTSANTLMMCAYKNTRTRRTHTLRRVGLDFRLAAEREQELRSETMGWVECLFSFDRRRLVDALHTKGDGSDPPR